MNPVILNPGDGERIGSGPTVARIMATAESTGGAFTLADTTIPPGFPGPPLHRHTTMTDAFFVLEGTLTVHLDGETVDAEPGSFVSVPPGCAHSFSNRGAKPARFLNINSPGGWEQYLRAVAQLVRDGAPDPGAWRDLMAQHDFVPC